MTPLIFMKPSLARGEIQLIGATTISEYRKYVEKDAALRAPFPAGYGRRAYRGAGYPHPLEGIKRINMRSTTEVKILHQRRWRRLCSLSARYINDRNLPDKAIDLIDEASSAARLHVSNMPDKERELRRRRMQSESCDSRAGKRHHAWKPMEQATHDQKRMRRRLIKKLSRLEKKNEKDPKKQEIEIGENEYR